MLTEFIETADVFILKCTSPLTKGKLTLATVRKNANQAPKLAKTRKIYKRQCSDTPALFILLFFVHCELRSIAWRFSRKSCKNWNSRRRLGDLAGSSLVTYHACAVVIPTCWSWPRRLRSTKLSPRSNEREKFVISKHLSETFKHNRLKFSVKTLSATVFRTEDCVCLKLGSCFIFYFILRQMRIVNNITSFWSLELCFSGHCVSISRYRCLPGGIFPHS